MEKNNKLIITIVILVICVLGLGGYITYDKIINNNNQTKEIVEKNCQGQAIEENNQTNYHYNNNDNNKNRVIEKLSLGKDGCAVPKEFWPAEAIIDGVILNGVKHKVKYIRNNDSGIYLDERLIYNASNLEFIGLCNYDDHFIVTLGYPSGPTRNILFDANGGYIFSFEGDYKYVNNLLDIELYVNPIDEPEDNYELVIMHCTLDLKANGFAFEYVDTEKIVYGDND